MTITNHAPETPHDVLRESRFHHLLVFFNRPEAWPAWKVGILLLLIDAVPAAALVLIGSDFRQAAAVWLALLLFEAADALLLWFLPRKKISFGSWRVQVIVLAIPRAFFAGLCSFIIFSTNFQLGMLILVAGEGAGFFLLLWASLIEPFRLQLTKLTVESSKVRPGRKPLRLLHISDLHVERLTRREAKVVELANQSQADLILITGDYLNLSFTRDPKALEDVRWLLDRLAAPGGVYAVLGSPTVDDREILSSLFDDVGITLLDNEAKMISLDGERKLTLIGVNCTHYLPLDALHLEDTVKNLTDHGPAILMYHSPDLFNEVAAMGLDLYLCGHTHGGQVRLPAVGALLTSSQFGRKYQMGRYQEGRTTMYVSRGIGLEGLSAPRVRLLAPPEITLITITGKE